MNRLNWNLKKLVLPVLLTCMVASIGFAQEEISDDVLRAYAQMEYEVESFKTQKTDELISLKTEQAKAKFGSIKRYKEVKSAYGDEAKMQALNVTDEEKTAFDEMITQEKEIVNSIKEFKVEKIKGENGIGAGVYNKVSKALKADAALEEKYQTFYEEVKTATTTDEEGQGSDM